MRVSFLITVTLCLLLLAVGVVWDNASGCGATQAALRWVGEMLAEPDPRPEDEKGILSWILNAIAMAEHRQSTCR